MRPGKKIKTGKQTDVFPEHERRDRGKMKKLWIVTGFWLVLCALGAAPVFAATYYVATNGSDSNDGSFDHPWLTIHKAAQMMYAGDTTYIRGGTYSLSGKASIEPTRSGSAGNYITFSNYQNETVIIDGVGSTTNVAFFLDSAHSYFRFIGMTMRNFSASGAMRLIKDNATSAYLHHIEIRNCTFKSCTAGSCVKLHGVHDVIFANCVFQNSKQGIEMAVVDRGNDYNVQVINCQFSGMSWDGVVSKVENLSNEPYRWCEDIYFTGCESWDAEDDGFDLFGRYFTLEHCIAHHVDASAIPPRNGIPYDEDGHGFKVYALDLPAEGGKYHADFYRCLSYRNNREGYKLTSLQMEDSSHYIKKFRLINCTAGNDDYSHTLVTNELHPMDIEYKNCIFSSRNLDPLDPWDGDDLSRALDVTGSPVIWSEGGEPVSGTPSYLTLRSDYNLWYSLDHDESLLEPIRFIGTLYTAAQINDGTYFAATGADEHSRAYNPLFVDENGDNYRLGSGSPAINAGTNLGYPYAGPAPDLGAFETGTTDLSSPSGYLTTGENWISIPLAAINDGTYSVFAGINSWPNEVYHNVYRWNTATGAFVEYPTYQSDTVTFGKIVPGGAYKLALAGNAAPITVTGVPLTATQTLSIPGSGTRQFYFGNPFSEAVLWGSGQVNNGGSVVSVAQAIANGWIGNVQHFNPAGKTWETIGTVLESWHAYRLEAYTSGALSLIIPHAVPYTVSGTVSFKYPGWTKTTAAVQYQVRTPGLPPTAPLSSGTLTVTMTPGNPSSGAFTIANVTDGTYDLALKHVNHIADLKSNVVIAGGNVTGLILSLWAGDADGDNNFNTVYPTDQNGDNDVDLKDYWTLYYQTLGSKPVTSGYNADFNNDGTVTLLDYNGLKYGYLNKPNPGNWYIAP